MHGIPHYSNNHILDLVDHLHVKFQRKRLKEFDFTDARGNRIEGILPIRRFGSGATLVPKPSVVVEGVSKKFGLSLRSALKYGLIDSGRRLLGKEKDSRLRPGEFWALDDVSFVLEPGDALGIMGVNGSGKTTLLRILNGTYSPDKGKVTLRGRIGALIAAGGGFSPMLPARKPVGAVSDQPHSETHRGRSA